MPRKIPDDRMEKVIAAAVKTFILSNGYHRTQMADIAAEAGVSKATLYLYVENKESLFDLAVRYADTLPPVFESASLPVPAPPAGGTLQYIVERLAADPSQHILMDLTATRVAGDVQAELASIVRTLYRAVGSNRNAIKLIDRCAVDLPELAQVWFTSSRVGVLGLLEPYITRRTEQGVFRPVVDNAIAARILVETCTFWAVHRYWDPFPQAIDEENAEAAVVELIQRMLLKGA